MAAALRLIVPFLYIAFMIFSIADVALTEKWRVRGVPKVAWIFIVVLLPLIGGIIWFVVGKEPLGGGQAGDRRQVAPDDDPDFLARMQQRDDQDERIRRLEQELADLDDDPPDK